MYIVLWMIFRSLSLQNIMLLCFNNLHQPHSSSRRKFPTEFFMRDASSLFIYISLFFSAWLVIKLMDGLSAPSSISHLPHPSSYPLLFAFASRLPPFFSGMKRSHNLTLYVLAVELNMLEARHRFFSVCCGIVCCKNIGSTSTVHPRQLSPVLLNHDAYVAGNK